MGLLWFLLGLAIGLSSIYIYRVRLKSSSKFLALLGKRDRTAIRSQLQQNQQAIATWQRIIQNAPIGYIQVDAENRLSNCNNQACRLLSINSCRDQTAMQKLLLQMVRSYELDQLIDRTRQTQQSLQQEWVFHSVAPDPLYPTPQQDRPLRGHSIVLEDGQIGIFIEDCQEAVSLSQQRDRWASDVAHELKTPLTSIRLIAETLQVRLEPGLRLWIDRLLDEVIRLSNLVQDLLELGKLDPGSALKLVHTSIDLPKLVHSVWASLEPLALKHRVRLEYHGPDRLLLEADESRIYRLLFNLFDNSIKYSPSLQIVLVKVSLVEAEDRVLIEIIDSGPGFPEAALPHIFDRFYRVDQSRSRLEDDRGGSGLGLAIVWQIVRLHEGTIKAENHPDTCGAWISVELPLHPTT